MPKGNENEVVAIGHEFWPKVLMDRRGPDVWTGDTD
jgi:hypothetical protein